MLEPPRPSTANGLRAHRRRDSAPLAVLLLGLGVVFVVLYIVFNGSEHHSFNSGALAPDTVHLTTNKQYEISTPGGVSAIERRGGDPSVVSCSYRLSSGLSAPLTVTALGSDTRTTHAIATFVSPVTGNVHIDCQGLVGGTYVDNSDGGATDFSGLFILLAAICLTGAAGFGMSTLYRRSTARQRDHDQIETGVDRSHFVGEHDEILDVDGRDLPGEFR